MSSKLLYSLSDEKKDLRKQIGCMNGFFQLFDRQHFLSTRRLKNNAIKRLPSGQTGNRGTETKTAFGNTIEDSHEMVREKQRTSTESSRTSLSSSSWSSSFSSLECNKTNQLEQSIHSQANFSETPSQNIPMNQPNPSHSRRPSFDLQDVVKDNIHKGTRELSVKTATKEKVLNHKFKHVDSPRPVQLLNSPKPKASSLSESPRVHGKVGEAPSHFIENRSSSLPLRDASRFSYDGTELRDSSRSSMKLKELPRLSLDSRRASIRDCNSTIRTSYVSADPQRGSRFESSNNPIYQQEPESCQGPSSVVARLMGLDAFPSVAARTDTQTEPNINCQNEYAPFSKSSKFEKEKNKNPRSSMEVISPKFSDSVVKSRRSSKIPIEPAPWRQQGESKSSCTPTASSREAPNNSNSFPSVYGEIEKRLAELEFRKSGRDLRALKQILEAMQKTKERVENRKENYNCDSVSQTNNRRIVNRSFDLSSPRSIQSDSRISSIVKGADSPKNFKSQILIMRPSELVENDSSASFRSVIDSPSRLKKLWTGDTVHSRRELVSKQTKDVNPRKNHLRDSSAQSPLGKNRNTKAFAQSKVPQQTEEDSFTSSSRNSGSVSPRPRQKKLALVNNSHSTTASTDSSTPRSIRQCSKQLTDPSSPRRKLKPGNSTLQQDGVQVKRISNSISMRSQQLSSTVTPASHIETEATSTDGSDTVTYSLFKQAGQIQTNLVGMLAEEKSAEGPIAVTLEQPSPVSVLEATFYREEPPSPIKKISSTFRDDQPMDTDEAEQSTSNLDHLFHSIKPIIATKISHNNIPNLRDSALHLEQTNSTHETTIDLFVKSNPNHRYILEILSASGLLAGADQDIRAVQLHSSIYFLDPKLFFLLEKTKTSTWPSDLHGENDRSNHYEKIQRQLTFDAVNEILLRKLVIEGSLKPWCSTERVAKRRLTGEQLFIDTCTEIDHLHINTPYCIDDYEDHLKGIMLQDLMNESMSWTNCLHEFSGVVLDVERLIFKDLINEVVSADIGGLKIRAGQHCRQLFN